MPQCTRATPAQHPHARLPRKETPACPHNPHRVHHPHRAAHPATRPTVHLEPQGRPQDTRTFHDVDELLRHLWLLLEGGVR
ncbi:hypothetical protein DEGR_13150 [Deinococcus grandis]|nr:hypothetical protein DEGR_13150 [Deinococcus grandis]